MDLCLKKTPEGTWLVLDQETGEILCGAEEPKPRQRFQAAAFLAGFKGQKGEGPWHQAGQAERERRNNS